MSERGASQAGGRRVWVLYHWLGHYRAAVCAELIDHSPNHYYFWGSDTSFGHGIRTITDLPDGRFRAVKTFPWMGLNLQPAAVWHALAGKYDTAIIHAGVGWPTMWMAAILGRLRGKKVYYWTHGWTRRDRPLVRAVKRLYFTIPHGIMLYGHFAKSLGSEAGLDPDRLHVIYNSLDVERQLRVDSEIGEDECCAFRAEHFGERSEAPLVICVSRLTGRKSIEVLIRACAETERSGRRVNLLIVGEGEARAGLEALASDLGVTAHFAGAVYDERALAVMIRSATVSVLPGPIGLFVMHSLVYGVPVISNDSFEGQMPEFEAILPGVTGDFFRSGDVGDLERVIGRWIFDERSPAARQEAKKRITQRYHPRVQRLIMDRAVSGAPADDSFVESLHER